MLPLTNPFDILFPPIINISVLIKPAVQWKMRGVFSFFFFPDFYRWELVDDSRLACQLIKHIQIVDVHVNGRWKQHGCRTSLPSADFSHTRRGENPRNDAFKDMRNERETDGRTDHRSGGAGRAKIIDHGIQKKKKGGGLGRWKWWGIWPRLELKSKDEWWWMDGQICPLCAHLILTRSIDGPISTGQIRRDPISLAVSHFLICPFRSQF